MRPVTTVSVLLLILTSAGALAQATGTYQVSSAWARLPANTEWGALSAVTTDRKGSVLVLRRTFPSMFVVSPQGELVSSWGDQGLFSGPGAHGVRVDRDGFIWATDTQNHQVYKLTMDGKVVLQVGQKGVTGDNRSHDAFNRPADVAVARNGDFFVADGYGNSRVVKFDRHGKFLAIIGGTKGTGPGQFDLVHAVVIDSKGRLLVGDRSNARIQIFDHNGTYLEQWNGLGKPYGLYITSDDTLYVGDADGGTITVAKRGQPVDVIRDLGRPHSISMDPNGSLYMADVRGFVKKITIAKHF
jgi:sugar lactone lactonase YvrE